jgi:hypothetical protein
MTQTRKHKNTNNKTQRIFKKHNFSSSDGMVTKIWGPIIWTALHTISFNYPINPTNEDKIHYKEFIYSLKYVLPCKYCRINLTKNFVQKPLLMCHMKNRETFSRYIYELHELVNKMLNKKSNLTYCDIRERYEHFRSRCSEESPKIFNFIKKSQTKKKKEKGCTEPLYGKKAKCIINIVPQEDKSATFKMDKKCIKSTVKVKEKVKIKN